jgi:dipeptidyl-peptidase-4
VSLRGAFYRPLGRKEGTKAPLVVMLYGGPHVQYVPDAWSLTADLRAQYLAQQGFAVWKMDNRGSARRGVAFESALYRRMGVIEVQDQVDGVAYVKRMWGDQVDTGRVGVIGRSYGGYMTLRCLTEAPDVFHAGVSEAPVTDWDGYDTCYTERYMGTPQNNARGYAESSVLTRAARIRGKLLIMHGLNDENVHFRHTARLLSALIQAGVPFDVLPMPGERHSSRDPRNRQAEVARLVQFFEAALKP